MPETLTRADAVKRLRRATLAHERRRTAAEEARDAMHSAALEAADAGATLEEIGDALGGLSKQRASDIVRAERAGRS